MTTGELTRSLVWNVAAAIGTKFKSIVLVVCMIRLVGIDGFGIWTQVSVVAVLLSGFASLGLYQSVVQFYPEARDDHERATVVGNALLLVLAAGAVVTLGSAILAPRLGEVLFKSSECPSSFRLVGLLATLYSVRLVLQNVFRAQDRLRLYSFVTNVTDLSDLIAVLALTSLFRSVDAAVVGNLVAALAVDAWLAMRILREVGVVWRLGSGIRKALAYSLPLVPNQVGNELLARGDRLLVGGFLGVKEAGLYSAMYSLMSLPQVVNGALTDVLFAKMVNRRWSLEGTKRIRARVLLGFGVLSTAFVVLMSIFGGTVLHVVADVNPGQLPATFPWTMLLTGLGVSCFGIGRLVSLDLFVVRRTLAVAVTRLLAAGINLGLNWALIPTWGLIGCGASNLASYLFWVLVLATLVRRASFRGRARAQIEGAASVFERAT